jgi:hypothetical protein
VQGLPLQLVLVLHPPLPEQEFFPFDAPQPPLPLQVFFPAQQCFSIADFAVFASFPGLGAAEAAAVVPTTNPVRAAPIRTLRTDFVICRSSPYLAEFLRLTKEVGPIAWKPASRTHSRQPQQNYSKQPEFGLTHPNNISIWDSLSIVMIGRNV